MEKNSKNGYTLSKQWWEFAADNPEKVKPKHGILYFYLVELNNKLKWVDTFGVPTYNTMKMLGIASYNTYKETFNDLEAWGLIKVVERAKNNHTARVIEISNFDSSTSDEDKTEVSKNDTSTDTEVSKNDTSTDTEVSKNDISGGIEVSNFDTILNTNTKPNIKQGKPDKPPLPPKDFVNSVLETFKEVFTGHVITQRGKQRKGAGDLISIFKEIYPDRNTDQLLTVMRDYFTRCQKLNDNWHRPKMSVHHIATNFNEINELMKRPKGTKRHEYSGAGTNWEEEHRIKIDTRKPIR